jgi:broad specificity phosphatase PhoE
MPRVFLVRHAESHANAGNKAVSANVADVSLTDRGHEQAKSFAESVTVRPDLIVSSAFKRAEVTASYLCARYPDTPFEVWPRLGEFTFLAPAKCVGTTVSDRAPWRAAYWSRTDPTYCDGFGAESFSEFVARAREFARRVAALDVGTVYVFMHGQFMSLLRCLESCAGLDDAALMAKFRRELGDSPVANCQLLEFNVKCD